MPLDADDYADQQYDQQKEDKMNDKQQKAVQMAVAAKVPPAKPEPSLQTAKEVRAAAIEETKRGGNNAKAQALATIYLADTIRESQSDLAQDLRGAIGRLEG